MGSDVRRGHLKGVVPGKDHPTEALSLDTDHLEETAYDPPMASKGSTVAMSDQKKRTLEALGQQFAAAKAKKLQDEQKCQKRNQDSTPRSQFDSSWKGNAPESASCRTSALRSSKKGNITISSFSPQQKASSSSGGEINPVYCELSLTLHDNLFQDDMDLDKKDVVHSVVYDILHKGRETVKFTKGTKSLKLEKGILLDNYVQKGPRLVDAQARSLMMRSKRSKKCMSMKQHRKCGSFRLHEMFHKFDLYKPMHEMWKEYIKELTKGTVKKQLSENLLTADLHGALLIVVECKTTSYQGVSGIMIRETVETFGIISEDNHFRVVPKAGSVFILQADCWKVTLYGDKLSPKEKLKESQAQQHLQSLIR